MIPLDDTFRARSPTASVPTIVDGDIVMGESIAILQYLTGRQLQKSLELKITVGPRPDPAAYAEHLQFLHMGESSLMAPLAILWVTRRRAPADQQSNFTTDLCEQRLPQAHGRPGESACRWTRLDHRRGFHHCGHLGRHCFGIGTFVRTRLSPGSSGISLSGPHTGPSGLPTRHRTIGSKSFLLFRRGDPKPFTLGLVLFLRHGLAAVTRYMSRDQVKADNGQTDHARHEE